MFDYEKLIAYQKAKIVNRKIQIFVSHNKINSILRDQLYRASTSILLNIAEGTGKLTKQDRKNFYVIARGSVFECASILELLNDEDIISAQNLKSTKLELEEVSRLLSGLIKNQTNNRII
ncbi:four helix bundle protein [Candidatus Peregrinibacteria bacterium]|nr:four helix bundle protein [Candidatus Peregrinibacteria bacterium]